MEPAAQTSSANPVRVAMENLCQLIDAIDQTTDLCERHSLFRGLHVAAETLGVLRMGVTPSSEDDGAGS
jgi:hypothetical protein